MISHPPKTTPFHSFSLQLGLGWAGIKKVIRVFFRSYSRKSRLPNHLNYLDKIWTCEALSESPVIARKFTKKNEVPPELLSLEVRGYPPTGFFPIGVEQNARMKM